MFKLRIGRRVTAALAVGVIAGTGTLAATSATATAADTDRSSRPSQAAPLIPQGKVVSRITLNIREYPTTYSDYLGGIKPGTIIPLYCKVRGQNVDGNNIWYLLGGSRPGYVAARYVKNLSPVPYCQP